MSVLLLFEELAGGLGDVVGVEDGANEGYACCAGLEDGGGVGGVYSSEADDGEVGELRDGIAESVEAGDWDESAFGGCGEDGAEGDVVGVL